MGSHVDIKRNIRRSRELNSDMEEAVDTKLLADWLSDILNGVRGRGELIMKYDGSTSASNIK